MYILHEVLVLIFTFMEGRKKEGMAECMYEGMCPGMYISIYGRMLTLSFCLIFAMYIAARCSANLYTCMLF